MRSQNPTWILLAGASALAFSQPVFAQDTSGAAASADDSAAAPQPAQVQEIVVTGSRVIKDGSNSPTPLTTVTTDSLVAASPTGTISDALNNLPIFSGSRNSFSNPGSNATGVQGGNGSANVLNLRNLGTTRTLVLFDGHRVPPTLFNGTVDVDIIPQELIKSVDVVTGGVSAVYGSDAVSGVVNYVLDRNFNGFRAHGEAGISQYGDAATRDIGGAFGFDVGDRGHFEASVEHREADGILHRVGSRSWDNLTSMQGGGTDDNPYYTATNVHLSQYTFGGLITSGALAGKTFNQNGVLSEFSHGTKTGTTDTSCCEIGGDGAYQDSSMISPSRGTQVFGRFDYDLTDDIHFYVQGAGNFKRNISYTGWNQLAGLTISATNAFLPSEYQAELAAAGESTFKLNEILSAAPRIKTDTRTTQVYANAGLEGHLGTWNWDATYTHGVSRMHTVVHNVINQQHLAAALDAVDDGNGNIVCAASLVNSAYSDCAPLNLFGPSAASSEALDYILGDVGFVTHTIMDSADASISGTPFSTWAGPVNVAFSGEWRHVTFDATSSTTTDYADCTDLTYNCTSGSTALYSTMFPSSDKVGQSVKEGAVEVAIPLLKDVPFFRSLDFNGAARYTSYSTSGDYWTWKLGGVWAVNDDLKFRGTLSRDIRAPNLYELFQPASTVWGNFNLRNSDGTYTTYYAPSVNIGNPDLKAEIGHTYTFGTVYKPHYLPGVTLTVDYYHTVIDDAITTVQGFNANTQTACATSGLYCDLIDTSGSTPTFYIQPYNLSKIKTWGVDGELDYATRLAGQPLNLRLLVNYQPHIYYIQGSNVVDQGDAGWGSNGLMPSPSVQVSAFVDYKLTDDLKVAVFEHYRNHFRRSGVASQVFVNPYVRSFATTNLTLTFDTGDAWKIQDSQFTVSVTNLFNAKPPLSGYYSGSTAAGQSYEFSDDPTGRAFMVGFKIQG